MVENINQSQPPFCLGLIAMPWALFNRPSVQLGALKGYLTQAEPDVKVSCLHPYLGLAKSLGLDLYREISQDVWLCEGLYAGLLFPEQRGVLCAFLAKRLNHCKAAGALSLEDLWQKVDDHLRHWLAGQDWAQFDLVGFSVCFNQLLVSLLAAREIKKMHPRLPIVFGGSSCVAEMGSSLLAVFPWLDYVVHGEGELPLANLCQVLSGRQTELVAQVLARKRQIAEGAYTGCQVKTLGELPVPDYDEYFQELRREFSGNLSCRSCRWNSPVAAGGGNAPFVT